MKTLFTLLVLSFTPTLSFATDVPSRPIERVWQKGTVTLKDNIPRYVEYLPAAPGKDTLVFTNGLVYDLRRWESLRQVLEQKGYGLVFYYFRGQHLTLKAETEKTPQPEFFKRGLDTGDFSEELANLLAHLKISQPVIVVGLSYGSHIAATFASEHPKQVKKLVFLAPLVQSLDKYDPQGAWVLQSLELIKLWWGPFLGPYFYESAYRQIYQSYLGQRVVPDRVPEELRDIPDTYRESVFHLIRAVRNFDLRAVDFSRLPKNSVSVILAKEQDENVFKDQIKTARGLEKSVLQQLIYMPQSSHAIPDSQGGAAAEILDLLLKDDARLQTGGASILDGDVLRPWTEAP